MSEWKPDLLVLDLVMPGDGRARGAAPAARRRRTPWRLPVLVLTAHSDRTSTRIGFDMGATDYLTKPFSMPQLAARRCAPACRPHRGLKTATRSGCWGPA